ncbi:hydantoinase B/oxoprolinase family protein [Chloroflexota bacterium]
MTAQVDQITTDVIAGRVDSLVKEMENMVRRMSRSPVIREQSDFRAAIFTKDGRTLTAGAPAFIDPVLTWYAEDEIKDGDIFLFNDPYLSEGGITHAPDMCINVPVLCGGEIFAWVQIFGHCEDVGGMRVGSLPAGVTEVFQEATLIPPIKIYDQGKLNKEAYTIILRNSRMPESLRGDLDAFMVGCRFGKQQMIELADKFGVEVITAALEALLERCRQAFKEKIFPLIPYEAVEFEDWVEDDAVEQGKHHIIKLKLSRTESKIIFDLTGTAPQAKGAVNWPGHPHEGRYYKKILSGILQGLVPGLMTNDGVCDLIDIVLPEDTLLSPKFPAPTAARTLAMMRFISVIKGVMAKISGGVGPADDTPINVYGYDSLDEDGRYILMREIMGSGAGGRPYADGNDAVDIAPESRNCPAEFFEQKYPVMVDAIQLAIDSGGPGRYRGGLGYKKLYKVLADGSLMCRNERTIFSNWGVLGGKASKPGRIALNPGTPEGKNMKGYFDSCPVRKGDQLLIMTSGGGGWGDPLERDPQMVRLDVMRHFVSIESARDDYGVVIDPSSCDEFPNVEDPNDFKIDNDATTKLREKIRCQRVPLRLFERGEYANIFIDKAKINISENPTVAEVLGTRDSK